MTTKSYRKREYTFFLSFTAFVSILFFLGIYMPLAHTVWLSLLLGGMFTWLILTFLIKTNLTWIQRSGIQRCLSLLAICYGGVMLCAFFSFSRNVIFPDHSFVFFPTVFLLLTIYGTEKGIDPLERTSKFASVAVFLLLILTVISTIQKIWDQRDFVSRSSPELFHMETDIFVIQTILITVLLLVQSLVLYLTVEQTCNSPGILRSIRKALVPGILLSALLYLMAAVALGTHSFEYLTYPIYDMLSLPGYAEYLDRTELLMMIIFFFCESCKTIASLLAARKLFVRQSQG